MDYIFQSILCFSRFKIVSRKRIWLQLMTFSSRLGTNMAHLESMFILRWVWSCFLMNKYRTNITFFKLEIWRRIYEGCDCSNIIFIFLFLFDSIIRVFCGAIISPEGTYSGLSFLFASAFYCSFFLRFAVILILYTNLFYNRPVPAYEWKGFWILPFWSIWNWR